MVRNRKDRSTRASSDYFRWFPLISFVLSKLFSLQFAPTALGSWISCAAWPCWRQSLRADLVLVDEKGFLDEHHLSDADHVGSEVIVEAQSRRELVERRTTS